MSLLVVIGILVMHAGAMLAMGHPLPSVLTLGLAAALALAGAGLQALRQWREGKSMDSLSARITVLEGESKQLQADFEALRTRNALERIGG